METDKIKEPTMKERVDIIKENVKVQETLEKRIYKLITIGSLKEQDLQPFDMFDDTFIKEKFENVPIKITWDTIVKLSNAAIESGKLVDDDTPYVEALNIFMKALNEGFLVNASTN